MLRAELANKRQTLLNINSSVQSSSLNATGANPDCAPCSQGCLGKGTPGFMTPVVKRA